MTQAGIGLSAALTALALVGCGPPSRSEQPPITNSNPWTACYAGFKPAGNSRGDLARLTRACGDTAGMRAVTPVRSGVQRAQQPADRFTFYVPRAGDCFRVFAAGDRGVRDLDLLVHGPDNEAVAADLTHDAWPVLPPHGPLCFSTPGLYMLEVSVFEGEGRYAVQVWGRAR